MPVVENLRAIRERIARAAERVGRSPNEVTLVAVTKSTDAAGIRAAFEAGVTHFGENRLQEAVRKLAELPDLRARTTWHMVGHLQSNKAKSSIQIFDIIQSVDSVRLSEALDRYADHPVSVFLEVNVAGETSKYGFRPEELAEAYRTVSRLPMMTVRGLMTVAPQAPEPESVRPVFRRLRELGRELELPALSMGMTDDFEVAVEEGATVVRIGRALFSD
jgi:pyridoxal phosphate enzyme (YggS family)